MQRSVVLGPVSEIETRSKAQELLEQHLRTVNHAFSRPQSVLSFREYAEVTWTNLILPTLKLSTQHGYKIMLKKHLVPYFGEFRLSDITRQDVQQFVLAKSRQELAWNTVRNAWVVLSAILDSAVKYEYLVANPARGVRFPTKPPRKPPKILSSESLDKLLAQLDEPYRTMLIIIVLTGVRIGELLAFRWRVIDLCAGTIQICESVFQDQFQTLKSDCGTRLLPIGPWASQVLAEHRQRSINVNPDALLFPWKEGRPYSESYLLQEILQPAGEAAGLGKVTWHQFRHIHSSQLHNMGVPAKIAQQQLGHASISTTFNIYTHVVDDAHRKAICDLERLLFPSVPKFDECRNSGEFVN